MKLGFFLPGAAALAFGLALSPVTAATMQSPVDFDTSEVVYGALDPLIFNYGTGVTLSETDTGSPDEERTVRADVPLGSTLTIGSVVYNLLQFHFHAEAEHTIDGDRSDMELHFVHSAASGALAVVGILVDIGAENTALAPYFDALGSLASGAVSIANFDLSAIIPSDTSSYRYTGSLTAPTLSGDFLDGQVAWNVLSSKITVSQAQFDAFTLLFPEGNSRDVQPLGDRFIFSDLPVPAAVPLPASGLLLLSVIGGLGLARRRRVGKAA